MKEEFINFTTFLSENLPIKIDFVGKTYRDKTFYFRRSNSSIMSLEYIVTGRGTLKINGREYEPESDNIFFLSLGSNHNYYSDKKNPWEKIYVSFSGYIADELVNSYLPKNEYVFENTGLNKVFTKIFEIAVDDSLSYEEKNDLIIIELLKILLSIKSNNDSRNLSLAEIIKNTLNKNIQKPYTIKQLSIDLNYTQNYLIDIFQEEYNETPYKYLCRKRIELAKEYLESTQFSVGEIADLLCYADSQYFSTCFKKAVGVTPSRYRKSKRI